MTVYFANDGKIDLMALCTMGVSVKETDQPIGYFGTGVKFAIATLLRTGHKVTLTVGGRRLPFDVESVDIRGKDFEIVTMGGEKLGFTTELGKNWQVWQAFRELHSNTLDEGGKTSDKKLTGDTVFEIEGAAMQTEFGRMHKIFLSTEPICEAAGVEVHRGASDVIYYRGVRAGLLPKMSKYTYNITSTMTLSEDRNFADMWDAEWEIRCAIPQLKDANVLTDILGANAAWDSGLNYSDSVPASSAFIAASRQFQSDANLNHSMKAILNNADQISGSFPETKLSEINESAVSEAILMTKSLECTVCRADLIFVKTLGPDVFGLYHTAKNQIFISQSTIEMGVDFMAATIYEEWLHKDHQLKDCTRAMQNFLFQKLIHIAKLKDMKND